MRVCLDPGHGGNDRANRGPTGYVEADGVLDIALRTRTLLQSAGLPVVMTRDRDAAVSLAARTAYAAAQDADILVSIHTDAYSDPRANGCTVFCSVRDDQSRNLAVAIEQALRNVGRPSRGVRTRVLADGRDYYHVIREARMPAVLVECAFHSNPTEEALLKTPEFRQLIATAIADGIKAFVGPQVPDVIPILLDGELLPVTGRLIGDVTYAPVRALAEALGLTVIWDGQQRLVRLEPRK
ncbi:MAG TPA: N-acetylmuramoyl-L-alanine amidase [Firmicutes bacterium]|nr:N-acetylmuramoyl-L-alanine amidase [Bacillota bacterium]